jgi:hypothetical protein
MDLGITQTGGQSRIEEPVVDRPNSAELRFPARRVTQEGVLLNGSNPVGLSSVGTRH